MLLENEFEIDADLEQAWNLLTDLERIAPCMPGAALDGRDGEKYLGKVKIKVGPIGATFAGDAHFTHKDDDEHTAVIAAAGKDPRGQAAASASIQAKLEAIGPTRTRVIIDTELDISGRMAQFGRGAIADVSNRLIGQFVANLSSQLTTPSTPSPAAASTPQPAPASPQPAQSAGRGEAPAQVAGAPEGGMDAMSLIVPMVKDRYGQAIIGGLSGFLLSWLVFGRRVGR